MIARVPVLFPRDENEIVPVRKDLLVSAINLPQESFHAISLNSASNPFAHGDAEASVAFRVPGGEDDQMSGDELPRLACVYLKVFPSFPQPLVLRESFVRHLHSQTLASLGPPSVDYSSSGLCAHANEKSMSSFASRIVWLKCPLHRIYLDLLNLGA